MTSLHSSPVYVLGMGCSGGAHWTPDLSRERNVLQVVAMRGVEWTGGRCGENTTSASGAAHAPGAVENMRCCLGLWAARARRCNEWREHRNGAVSHCDAECDVWRRIPPARIPPGANAS